MIGRIHHALFCQAKPQNSLTSRPKCLRDLIVTFHRARARSFPAAYQAWSPLQNLYHPPSPSLRSWLRSTRNAIVRKCLPHADLIARAVIELLGKARASPVVPTTPPDAGVGTMGDKKPTAQSCGSRLRPSGYVVPRKLYQTAQSICPQGVRDSVGKSSTATDCRLRRVFPA
jgi:hypothetical protein